MVMNEVFLNIPKKIPFFNQMEQFVWKSTDVKGGFRPPCHRTLNYSSSLRVGIKILATRKGSVIEPIIYLRSGVPL